MDVNISYINNVIQFMKDVLISKEKKHFLTQGNLKTQWKNLLNAESEIFLIQVKACHDLDDFAFFSLLLAISLEVSREVKEVFQRVYETQYATIYLALQVYRDMDVVNVQEAQIAILDENWYLFYASEDTKGTYLHDRVLLLQPWILPYSNYGGVMRCRYISFIYIEKAMSMKEEVQTSFLKYSKQGMKAIVTHDDEILLLQTLNAMQMPVCTIDLTYVPPSWNVYTLFSFCSFYAKVIRCAFFMRYSDKLQRRYLKPILTVFPFTFLITSEEVLPSNMPILRMPYTIDKELITTNNAYVKDFGFQSELPQFIGDKSFLNRLDEFMYMAKHKEDIYHLLSSDSASKGISALFYGPSGNGKTLSARHIAKQLGKRLWQIELSNVIDKYIGESEKHLETIFHEAEKEDVILLFDEADTLFTKRTNVQDANDRYANAITSYLLQRMENFPGIMILTSNYLHNFDDAFLRRIHCILRFYEANKEQRLEKWRFITKHMEIEETVDWDTIASIKLSYARIDQCLFAACSFMLAQQQTCLCEYHIKKAIVYELEKHGELPPKNWFHTI